MKGYIRLHQALLDTGHFKGLYEAVQGSLKDYVRLYKALSHVCFPFHAKTDDLSIRPSLYLEPSKGAFCFRPLDELWIAAGQMIQIIL